MHSQLDRTEDAARACGQRLRVLFIPQWYPSADGANRVAGTFCREHVHAASLYDDVAVLAFFQRKDKRPTLTWSSVDDHGVPTFYAGYGTSPIPRTSRLLFYWHLRRAYQRIVSEWGRPDVIHTQDAHAYFVIRSLQHCRIPFVVSQHWSGFLRDLVTKRGARQFKWAFERAVRVLPVNRFAEVDYRRYGLFPSVTWLPNVLDRDIFHPPSDKPDREPYLLHVSGFMPEKRVSDVIRAFGKVGPQYPHARLLLAGDGTNRRGLEELAARELPAERVRFLGVLPKPRIAELMQRAAGLVMASEAETFCCVLMEAMACGCPVLTTRVGGIPAVVQEGDGLFAEVGNIEQLAQGMSRLLSGAHGLDMQRISQEVRSRFSYRTVGKILHDEHRRAASSGVGRRSPEVAGVKMASVEAR